MLRRRQIFILPAINFFDISKSGLKRMLGFIFFEFKQYVLKRYDYAMWERVTEQVHVSSQKTYKNNESYSDDELLGMIGILANETNQTINEVEEDLGVFLAPFLIRITSHMIDPNWGLLELLLHTQGVIHARLAKSIAASTTPFLDISQTGSSEVTIIYRSPRRMCSLAKGLLKGMSALYHSPISIEEPSCMHRGDSQCMLKVVIESPSSISRNQA